MQMDSYLSALRANSTEYIQNVDLSQYCSYKTGGKAPLMVFPADEKQLALCRSFDCPFAVIGNATNVLFSDEGFQGIIINTSKLNKIEFSGASVIAESGANLTHLLDLCELNCLGGLEFTDGIPATVGGAVCMNAGCFSKCVGDYVSYAVTDKKVYNNAECLFAYRGSVFLKNSNEVLVSVCFLLKPGESDIIEAKREKFKKLRKKAQPRGRTCGSVFVNDGYFAGKIIDLAGLKGYSVGGARISEKHANFIIAEKGATSRDIKTLIDYVKKRVYETQGINLKEELRYIGNFND